MRNRWSYSASEGRKVPKLVFESGGFSVEYWTIKPRGIFKSRVELVNETCLELKRLRLLIVLKSPMFHLTASQHSNNFSFPSSWKKENSSQAMFSLVHVTSSCSTALLAKRIVKTARTNFEGKYFLPGKENFPDKVESSANFHKFQSQQKKLVMNRKRRQCPRSERSWRRVC